MHIPGIDSSLQFDEKVVRVFISSTFIDFDEERRVLMGSVFPRLREKYASRNVSIVGIDLRWGLTDERIHEAGLVDSCVGQIQECFPYFMGLVGGRYGTCIGQADLEASKIMRTHSLGELGGRPLSITELEFEFGALHDHNEYALFFVNDAVDSIDLDAHRLREKVDVSAGWKTCHYLRIEEFAEQAYQALDRLIEQRYPDDGRQLDPESASRLATLFGHVASYVPGNPVAEDVLKRAAAGQSSYVLGAKGVGKSALLSYCISMLSHEPHATVLFYYCDTGFYPHEESLFERILTDVAALSQDGKVAEGSRQGSAYERLTRALSSLSLNGPLYLVVDALEQVRSNRNLWKMLSAACAANGRTCCVASGTEAYAEPHETLTLTGLTDTQIAGLVQDHLLEQGREMDASLVRQIVTSPAAANPIILGGILNELDISATHQHLAQQIADVCSIDNIQELFDRIIGRVRDEVEGYGIESDAVFRAMHVIRHSRNGVTEDELEQICSMPPLAWITLRNSIRPYLLQVEGRYRFNHQLIEQAAQRCVSARGIDVHEVSAAAVAAYEKPPVSTLRLSERVSWTSQLGDAPALAKVLFEDEAIDALLAVDRYGLLEYLARFQGDESELLPRLAHYLDSRQVAPHEAYDLALQLSRSGCLDSCVALVEHYEASGQASANLLLMKARAIYQMGYDYPRALAAFDEAERAARREGLESTPDMANLLLQHAIALKSSGHNHEAYSFASQARRIHEDRHARTAEAAWCLVYLGSLEFLLGDPHHKLSFDEGLRISEEVNGSRSYPHIRLLLYSWQRYAVGGDLEQADILTERTMRSLLKLTGEGPDYAWSMTNRSSVLALMGRYEESRTCGETSARINDLVSHGSHHVYSLTNRNNDLVMRFAEHFDAGEPTADWLGPLEQELDELIADATAIHGAGHPYPLNVRANIALVRGLVDRKEGAAKLHEVSHLLMETLGRDNPDSLYLDLCAWCLDGFDARETAGLEERHTRFGRDDAVAERLLVTGSIGNAAERWPRLHLTRNNGAALYMTPFYLF